MKTFSAEIIAQVREIEKAVDLLVEINWKQFVLVLKEKSKINFDFNLKFDAYSFDNFFIKLYDQNNNKVFELNRRRNYDWNEDKHTDTFICNFCNASFNLDTNLDVFLLQQQLIKYLVENKEAVMNLGEEYYNNEDEIRRRNQHKKNQLINTKL